MPLKSPPTPSSIAPFTGWLTTPMTPSATPVNSETAPWPKPSSMFFAFLRLRMPRSLMNSLSAVIRLNTPARLPVALFTPPKTLRQPRLPADGVLRDESRAPGDDLRGVVSVVREVADVSGEVADDLRGVAEDVQRAEDRVDRLHRFALVVRRDALEDRSLRLVDVAA